MLRDRLILTVILFLIVTSLGFFLLYDRLSDNKDSNDIISSDKTEIPPNMIIEEDQSVRAEIIQKGLDFKSNDTMTYLGSNYSENTPLVEIKTQIREIDGSVKPLRVPDLGLWRIGWANSYGVEGDTLRLQLGDEQLNRVTLLFGEEYNIVGNFPVDKEPQYEFTGRTREQKFIIPSKVDQGKICRINVVLIDKLLEKELNVKKEEQKKQLEEIAEQETIKVTWSEVPAGPFVIYYDGSRVREEVLEDPNAAFIEMKGPNELGGELVVFVTDSNTARCWAYIQNLKKRLIKLPEDADIVCEKEDLVDLTIILQNKDVTELAKREVISFYTSAEAKLPIFGINLRNKLNDIQPDETKKLLLKIKPGTFYARLGRPMKEEISLGTVTINETGSNTWEINLSN